MNSNTATEIRLLIGRISQAFRNVKRCMLNASEKIVFVYSGKIQAKNKREVDMYFATGTII